MLLEITSTAPPATDLGYLLHKNPANVRSFDLAFGQAHVFYPEATEERCTAALLLEVDPIGLVRRGRGRPAFALAQYVNDRPYAASSFLSVALAKVYGSALAGRCEGHAGARPDAAAARGAPAGGRRAAAAPSSRAAVRAARLRGGDRDRSRSTRRSPSGATSRYLDVTIRGRVLLRDLLPHLYVLLPVLDDDKHYWVERRRGRQAAAQGGDWLGDHPRARADHPPLPRATSGVAHARSASRGSPEDDERRAGRAASRRRGRPRAAGEPGGPAPRRRAGRCSGSAGAGAVLDLGCGDGKLLAGPARRRARSPRSSASTCRIGRSRPPSAGCTSTSCRRASASGSRCSRVADLPRRTGSRATTRPSLMEVIEHLDPPRLPALERVRVRRTPRPRDRGRDHARTSSTTCASRRCRPASCATATTGSSGPGREFRAWAERRRRRATATGCGSCPSATDDPEVGPPTQMAVFDADDRRSPIPELLAASCLVGVVRVGQVHLRAPALPADRGAVVATSAAALVADDENDQAATDDAFDVLHYIAGKRLRAGRLTVVDATNVQPRRAQAAGRAGPRARRAAGRDRARPAGGVCRERNADRARPRLRPARGAPPARAAAPVAARACAARGLPARCTCCTAPRRSTRADDRARAAVQRPPRPDRAVRHHRRRARLPRRAARRCSTQLGYAIAATTGRPVDAATRTGGRRSSSATWSTAARTRPACCAW